MLIILGAPVGTDGRPRAALQGRIDCAVNLLKQDPNLKALATGGVPPGAGCPQPEAEVIAEALRDAGIEAERILLEPCARNTWENADRALRLLRGERSDGPFRLIEQPSVHLVTDPWHVPRALLAFRAHGARPRSVSCRVARWPGLLRMTRALSHELVGYAAYLARWFWLWARSHNPRSNS